MVKIVISLVCLLLAICQAEKLAFNSPMPKLIKASNYSVDKPDLKIHYVTTYGGHVVPLGPVMTVGAQLALDTLQTSGILSNYNLVVEMFDDKCNHAYGIPAFVRMLESTWSDSVVPIVAGPICGVTIYTSQFMKHYKFVSVTPIASTSQTFIDRSRYGSFFPLLPAFEIHYEAIPVFAKHYNWNKLYIMSDSKPFYSGAIELIIKSMNKHQVDLVGLSKFYTPVGSRPEARFFEMAVKELKASGARVSLVLSNFVSLFACFAHKYQLYGPGYVYIIFNFSGYLPNARVKFWTPWCEPWMLYEVLQSTFYFTNDLMADSRPDEFDSLGLQGHEFNNYLMKKIHRPDLKPHVWYFLRGFGYDLIASSALVLDRVEAELNSHNDNWSNWLSGTQNFQQNGSYIHELVKKAFNELKFEGMGTTSKYMMKLYGPTAFFQYQAIQSDSHDISTKLKPVPVIIHENGTMRPARAKVIWRTTTGQAPFDSLRTYEIEVSVIPRQHRWPMLVVTLFLLALNVVIAISNIYKGYVTKIPAIVNSFPAINSATLLGNVILLISMALLASDTFQLLSSCTASAVLAVFGFAIVTNSILAKLHFSNLISPKASKKVLESGRKTMTLSFTQLFCKKVDLPPTKTADLTNPRHITKQSQLSVQSKKSVGSHRPSVFPGYKNSMSEERTLRQESKVTALIFAGSWTTVQVALTIIWLVFLEPIEVIRVDRELVYVSNEQSVAFQKFAIVCRLRQSGTTTIAYSFLGILAAMFGVVFFRSLMLAFLLRKSLKSVEDLALVRVASYSWCLLTVAGGLVTWAFFATDDPADLITAISALVLIIVFTITCLIGLSKFRKGFFFNGTSE